MSQTHTDVRALRRNAASDGPGTSHPSPTAGAAVPRPRARWATRWLLPAAVLLATGAILAYAARDAFRPAVGVHVTAAIPKPVSQTPGTDGEATGATDPADTTALGPVAVQAPGWIEPAPFAISVPALAEGVVSEVLVLEGQTVERGQVVARLIDDDARLSAQAAQAVVAEREADVHRAAAAVETALSNIEVERLAAEEVRDEVNRKRDLVNVGAASAGDFRRLEIRLSALEAKIVSAERLADESRAVLRQAESSLAAAKVAQREAELMLSRMEVRTPVGGVVLARLVEPGSRISMGNNADSGGAMLGTVLRVYDPARLQVRVDVPLADAAKVGVGTRAAVSTEALADRTFTGVVSRVVHEANIQRNTVQFKVALDAPSPVLKPEMLTRVKLHAPAPAHGASNTGADGQAGETGDFALLIPAAAVIEGKDGKGSVWVVEAGERAPVARRREVAFENDSDPAFVLAVTGLRLTDRIIVDAPASVRDGTRVRVLGERPIPQSTAP